MDGFLVFKTEAEGARTRQEPGMIRTIKAAAKTTISKLFQSLNQSITPLC